MPTITDLFLVDPTSISGIPISRTEASYLAGATPSNSIANKIVIANSNNVSIVNIIYATGDISVAGDCTSDTYSHFIPGFLLSNGIAYNLTLHNGTFNSIISFLSTAVDHEQYSPSGSTTMVPSSYTAKNYLLAQIDSRINSIPISVGSIPGRASKLTVTGYNSPNVLTQTLFDVITLDNTSGASTSIYDGRQSTFSTWPSVVGPGGRATNAPLPSNTMVYLWVIYNSSTKTLSTVLATSTTIAGIDKSNISGYDYFALISCVYYNGTLIKRFIQHGYTYRYLSPVQVQQFNTAIGISIGISAPIQYFPNFSVLSSISLTMSSPNACTYMIMSCGDDFKLQAGYSSSSGSNFGGAITHTSIFSFSDTIMLGQLGATGTTIIFRSDSTSVYVYLNGFDFLI